MLIIASAAIVTSPVTRASERSNVSRARSLAVRSTDTLHATYAISTPVPTTSASSSVTTVVCSSLHNSIAATDPMVANATSATTSAMEILAFLLVDDILIQT